MTIAGQVILTNKIVTVFISILAWITIKLHNIALTPNCDLDLIFLGQLWESGIMYHNNPNTITLMRNGKIIAHAKKKYNLFTFESIMLSQVISAIGKAMAITRQGLLTHFVSLNKRICLWNWQFIAHVSNAQLVRALTLVEIIDFGLAKEYNQVQVFIQSKDSDNSGDNAQPTEPILT